MSTPPIEYRHVRGRYLAPDGSPVAGSLRLVPTATVYDTVGGVVVAPTPIMVALGDLGTFEVLLAVTDATGTTPTGWAWRCAELFAGGREWDFQLPASSSDPVDLSALAPASAVEASWQYATLAAHGLLEARVEAVEATAAVAEIATVIHPFLLMGV